MKRGAKAPLFFIQRNLSEQANTLTHVDYVTRIKQ